MQDNIISRFFALQRNTVALFLMVVLVGMGERIAERFLPLYLLALGGTITSIGIFSGANNLINALYSFFGGYLSDRMGHKKALLLFNVMTIAGYSVVIFFPYWQSVIVGSLFFLSWSAISMPATLILIANSVSIKKRVMGVSMNSLIRRIPMIVGPLLGGLLIERFGEVDGIRYSFTIAIVMTFFSLLIQQRLISSSQHLTTTAVANPIALLKHMTPPLKNLLLSDILIRFCEQIPYAFVVIWCVEIARISPMQFGLLTTVEMFTALLIYIPVAYFADKTTKKPFVVTTFVFFTFFPLALMFAKSYTELLVVFILRGLKEFGEPTRKALILDLCPNENKAGMFGFYYFVRDSIVAIAAFFGALLWGISPDVNFLSAFTVGFLGTIWFMVKGK